MHWRFGVDRVTKVEVAQVPADVAVVQGLRAAQVALGCCLTIRGALIADQVRSGFICGTRGQKCCSKCSGTFAVQNHRTSEGPACGAPTDEDDVEHPHGQVGQVGVRCPHGLWRQRLSIVRERGRAVVVARQGRAKHRLWLAFHPRDTGRAVDFHSRGSVAERGVCLRVHRSLREDVCWPATRRGGC